MILTDRGCLIQGGKASWVHQWARWRTGNIFPITETTAVRKRKYRWLFFEPFFLLFQKMPFSMFIAFFSYSPPFKILLTSYLHWLCRYAIALNWRSQVIIFGEPNCNIYNNFWGLMKRIFFKKKLLKFWGASPMLAADTCLFIVKFLIQNSTL